MARLRSLWIPGLFLALAFILYANTLSSGLHLDDMHVLGKFRFDPFVWSSRVVTELTFALNYQLHGMGVAGYHVVNTVIHAACAWMLFVFIRLLGVAPVPALCAGLLFLVHPLCTQAVTYICQRYSSLAALFFMSALVCYVKARGGASRAWWWYAAALVLSVCAVLSKEYAAILPVILLLVEWFFVDSDGNQCVRKMAWVAPFFLFSFATLAIAGQLPVHSVSSLDSMLPRWAPEGISRLTYLASEIRIICTVYLKLMVFPFVQNIDHSYLVTDRILSADVAPYAVLSLFLLGLGVWVYRKEKLIAFGIFWIFIVLAPTSSLIPNTEFVAEQRAYLPVAGISFIVAGIWRMATQKRTFVALSVAVIVLFAVLTVMRNQVWKNEFTLWEDALKKSPTKARVWATLGKAYLDRKDYVRAREMSEKAVQLDPMLLGAHNNLAICCLDYFQNDQKAEEIFEHVLKKRPDCASAMLNLGVIHLRRRELDQAVARLEKAMELDRENEKIYFNLAGAYFNRGQYEKALDLIKQGLAYWPNSDELNMLLGLTWFHLKEYEKAEKQLQQALKKEPGNRVVRMYLERFPGESH
jgi:tetratricopeptide (TPR) repeat protein